MTNSINDLNELSDLYFSHIAEQEGTDNTPENVKVRVLQIVKAIRYKAKKEGGNIVKAFNDYMGGQSGVGAAERQMIKQRLGLSEEVGVATDKQQQAIRRAKIEREQHLKIKDKKKVKKETYSNWRDELREVADDVPVTDKEMEVTIKAKKIKNKIIINPPMQEEIKKMGGEILEMTEIDEQEVVGGVSLSPQEINTQKRMAMLNVRLAKQRQKSLQKVKPQDDVKKEDYETKKKGEVLKALDKKKFVKRYGKEKAPDVMYAVASKTAKTKGDTSKSDDRYAYEEYEDAVDYFYAEGINEEGIDLIIEEVGLDDFVDFVTDTEFLSEERAARKMNVRTLKSTKKKALEIKADKSDVVKKAGPKDVLQRAAAIRGLKKRKLAKPAPKEVAKKDYDGDGKVETPKAEHRGSRNKAITKAVEKVKPTQPKKEVSKDGIRAKIKSAVDAGVKRHKKAVQPARVFAKGMKAGAKSAIKFAGKAKKAIVGEEVVDEAKVDTGSPEAKASARNVRNTPPGKDSKFDTSVFITRKPGESLDSARTRTRQKAHGAKRGVKEDKAFDNVVGVLRKKYGKDAVLTKDSPTPKASTAKQIQKRDERTAAQREVDAQYGRTPWNKKGSLGT